MGICRERDRRAHAIIASLGLGPGDEILCLSQVYARSATRCATMPSAAALGSSA